MADPTRLVGVYHARGTVGGELAYLARKLTGRGRCALCDITHGALRKRPGFDACAAVLPVPLELVHLDEREPAVAAASERATPCVLVERAGEGWSVLMDAVDLAACGSDPAAFVAAAEAALADLPSPP